VTAGDQLVGFVGAGAMGGPMVRRLAGSGRRLVVHDRDAGRLEELAGAAGVEAATDLAALHAAGVVLAMLPDSDAVESVVARLLDVLRPGALVIDMGSSEPGRTVALAERARAAGLDLVDAPVSGGVARAVTGDLTIMFGGSPDLLDRCRPLLQALGSTITHVGPVGAGHAMKALNNLLSAIGLAAAGEVIEVGRRFGLRPEVMLDVLNRSTGRNHATETKIARFVLSERFDSGFALRLMVKDVAIAAGLAAGTGVATPIADACVAAWRAAAAVLPPDADHTWMAAVPRLAATPRAR
jgi:3-hydroxyisobutyrate dehydrogenase